MRRSGIKTVLAITIVTSIMAGMIPKTGGYAKEEKAGNEVTVNSKETINNETATNSEATAETKDGKEGKKLDNQKLDIATLYITSDNPEKEGRAFVEKKKSNKTSGSLKMVSEKGKIVYEGALTQIKGRGNSTWNSDKKPYQIKLDEKCDLIETGKKENAAKTWVLLANAYDATLLHNLYSYKLAAAMGIAAPDCRPVELYYDGEYRGNYLLSEKVEPGNGRVAMSEDGFLLEMDYAYYAAEDTYFIDAIGAPFVVKAPEECNEEQLAYISNYMTELSKAAIAAQTGNANPDTGKYIWDYIDMDSLVRYYMLQELTKNADSFGSSTYFYMPKKGAKLIAGPAWDFDDAFGVREDVASPEELRNTGNWIATFTAIPEFRKAVKNYDAKKLGKIVKTSLGNKTSLDGKLWSIQYAADKIAPSAARDKVLWADLPAVYLTYPTFEENVNYFKNFLEARYTWLHEEWSQW